MGINTPIDAVKKIRKMIDRSVFIDQNPTITARPFLSPEFYPPASVPG